MSCQNWLDCVFKTIAYFSPPATDAVLPVPLLEADEVSDVTAPLELLADDISFFADEVGLLSPPQAVSDTAIITASATAKKPFNFFIIYLPVILSNI
jgi:hypothetical protein